MFRRLLLAVVTALALSAVSAVPANASCGLVTQVRFWDYHLCMAIGDTTIEAPYLAQQWNIRGGMAIQAANNCVTAGYPPSRRFTIDTFWETQGPCWKILGPNGAQPALDAEGNWWRYTNNPVLWVNRYCGPNVAWRRHNVSRAMGNLMALDTTNSAGYNARVMNGTVWSYDNVPTADPYSGALLEDVYNGACD